MQVTALAKGVRMSPRKVSLVASLVRGRTVADALVILEHTPKRAAKPVQKAIASAKANAVTNHAADVNSLVIEHLTVTAGTRIKRFRPAAQGRALPFQKKTSHIKVVLTGAEKPKKTTTAAEAKPAAKKAEKEA
jgi:large subunit ribosomal protein L22